jgi:hypothetical protein
MRKLLRLAFSSLLLLSLSEKAYAECPLPLPNQPTPNDLRECFNRIAELQAQIAQLHSEIDEVKRFSPYAFTASGCEVGKEVGILFALHDSNMPLVAPTEFSLSGQKAAGLDRHEWAIMHVCKR